MINETPKIYVACLAAYNNAKLHGVWIDATDNTDHIQDQIKAMLATSPEPDAEEYAIHDYNGFGDNRYSEYETIDKLHAIACFIVKHGELASLVLDHFCGDLEDATRALADHYAGEYASVEDFAQEIAEETTDIPDNLSSYIDYKAMAYDLEISDIFTVETCFDEVHIFWNL